MAITNAYGIWVDGERHNYAFITADRLDEVRAEIIIQFKDQMGIDIEPVECENTPLNYRTVSNV